MPRPPQCKPAHKKENKKATCHYDKLPFFISSDSKESQLMQQRGKYE